MAMYVVYLLKKRHLTASMSSYQVLRNTLLHLGEDNQMLSSVSTSSLQLIVTNSGALCLCSSIQVGRGRHQSG
jgi:hypothetical protein